MNSAKHSIFMAWLGFILLVASSVAKADMASGTYNADMGTLAPVWDVSGTYRLVFDYSYYESCAMDLTVTQSTAGLLGGSGSYYYDYDNYYDEALHIEGVLATEGSIKTSGGKTKVSMNFKIAGSGYIEVDYYSVDLLFTETVNFNFLVDTNNYALSTEGAIGKAKFVLPEFHRQFSSQQGFWATQMPLADSASSGWTLSLNLTPNKNKYNGTATVVTQSGQTINYTVGGTYSTRTDTSTLMLRGGKSGTLNLVVSTSGSELTILKVKGKLLGQSLNYQKL